MVRIKRLAVHWIYPAGAAVAKVKADPVKGIHSESKLYSAVNNL